LPGVLVCNTLSLSYFLIPLGKEKGCGYFHRTPAKGESFSKSYLYECETVPQLSHVYSAHFEGFITSLLPLV